MSQLAPICISTYSRLEHLKQTISALQVNTLAKASELYIFSDAPKPGDEEKVDRLRSYIHSVDGFKQVHIVERKTNSRVANGRGGIKQLLAKYGKMIFIEDDIVTAPGFLQFMNDGLDFYKNDERILSITGYCPPIKIPDDCNQDVFMLQRFSAWGFGTWAEKFDPFGFDVQKHGITNFLKDKKAIKSFCKNGKDMYPMLLEEAKGELDALDVQLMYYEFKYNKYTIYPVKSLVQNIGHDGSGEHCVKNNRHNVDLWYKTNFKLEHSITPNREIIKANFNFGKIPLIGKIITLTKMMGIYPFLKMLFKSD